MAHEFHRSPPFRRLPAVSLGLAALAVALWMVPGASELFQLDRTAVSAGAWWRLATGQFTHWTASHVLWDVAAFLLFGSLVERNSRRMLLGTLALSIAAISTQVWFLEPLLESYRGLSGLDSALFAAFATDRVADGLRRRCWPTAIAPALAFAGLAAKFGYEAATANTLFVRADPAFVTVPSAHITGALAGTVVALAASLRAHPPARVDVVTGQAGGCPST